MFIIVIVSICISKRKPSHPVPYEKLIVLKIQRWNYRHIQFHLLKHLLMFPSLSKLFKPSVLLLFTCRLLVQYDPILVQNIQKCLITLQSRRLVVIVYLLITLPQILSCLYLSLFILQLFKQDPGHFFKSISTISFRIIFRSRSFDSTWILTKIFLKFLNLIFFLFIMICINSLPNKFSFLNMIRYRL